MQTVTFLTGGRQTGITTKLLTTILEYTQQKKKVVLVSPSKHLSTQARQRLEGIIGAAVHSDLIEFHVSLMEPPTVPSDFAPLELDPDVDAVFIELDDVSILKRANILRNADYWTDVDFYVGTSLDAFIE